jgi:hypothetical protein
MIKKNKNHTYPLYGIFPETSFVYLFFLKITVIYKLILFRFIYFMLQKLQTTSTVFSRNR